MRVAGQMRVSLMADLEGKQLIRYDHVQRLEDIRLLKKIIQWVLPNRPKCGRPKNTWTESVTKVQETREGQWGNRLAWKSGIGRYGKISHKW